MQSYNCLSNILSLVLIAEYFGGGGHPYAAGFRTYDLSYEDTVHELITAITTIKEKDNNA